MFCVPNLVPLSMIPLSKAPTYKAQFGVEIVYQIGYSRGCTQLGTVFHIPAIFSRLNGILLPGMMDIIKMTGLTSSDDQVPLPNTYQTIPNYRYPYYDSNGRGYLLYGYGKGDLYTYSEFDAMEGYY